MSADNRFFNFHLEASCASNSKIGFQSLDSDVSSLKKNLRVVRGWTEGKAPALKDGDIIQVYARYTETSSVSDLNMVNLTMADGSTVAIPKADDEDAEIPC